MPVNKEQITRFITQGRHRQALAIVLDLVRENPQVHNIIYAAQLISKQLDTQALGFKPLRIAFLRTFTLELIEPFLITTCAEMDIKVDLYFAPFNAIQQEIIDRRSALYRFTPNIVVVAARIHELCGKLIFQFPSLSAEQVRDLSQDAIDQMDKIITSLAKDGRFQVILHNFERPAHPAMGLIDGQLPNGQSLLIAQMNAQLRQLAASYPNIHILDYDGLRARLGAQQFEDIRGWYLAKAPVSALGLAELAKEYAGFVGALSAKTKKCLVLDLDNTLWGGIIGEDGLEGIKLGGDYPGNAFAEFQQVVLNLYHRGVILAVASKNNPEDILEVFAKHPEMILRQEHFATMHIDWKDKAQSLKAIAAELNIGTDCLVFMDDSDFECALVRRELPEVLTVKLPVEPAQYRSTLEGLNCFDLLAYTAEDRSRGQEYRQQMQRAKLKDESPSLEDFYRSLQIHLLMGPPEPGQLNRLAQMTQKTNQFNLTTRRYQLSDIQAMLDSPDALICALKYIDRFGDAGLVGLAIVKTQGRDWLIDTFLLSCRVIGRTVEQALLTYLVRQAHQRGIKYLIAQYLPTAKNSLVKDFYPQQGFAKTSLQAKTLEFQGDTEKLTTDYADYLQVEER